MNYFLSTLSGIFIAVMIWFNGELSNAVGIYQSAIMFNIIALFCIGVLLFLKKNKAVYSKLPLWLYTGGIFNVITIVFNNIAFGKISVSAILAISLVGQVVISALVDHFGWFHMPKIPFNRNKGIGFLVVILGIIVLSLKTEAEHYFAFTAQELFAIVVCTLTGISVVMNRIINGELARRTSTAVSTFWNYAVSVVFIVLVALIFGTNIANIPNTVLHTNPLLFMGALLGVSSVFIMAYVATRISSFAMTLLIFVGQVFAGIAIDILIDASFSLQNLLGGTLVLLGLCVNMYFDKKAKQKLVK